MTWSLVSLDWMWLLAWPSIAGRFGKFEEILFVKLFMFSFPFRFGRFLRFSQKEVIMFEDLIEAPLILASGILPLSLLPKGVFFLISLHHPACGKEDGNGTV